jgi:hypothetical protein
MHPGRIWEGEFKNGRPEKMLYKIIDVVSYEVITIPSCNSE